MLDLPGLGTESEPGDWSGQAEVRHGCSQSADGAGRPRGDQAGAGALVWRAHAGVRAPPSVCRGTGCGARPGGGRGRGASGAVRGGIPLPPRVSPHLPELRLGDPGGGRSPRDLWGAEARPLPPGRPRLPPNGPRREGPGAAPSRWPQGHPVSRRRWRCDYLSLFSIPKRGAAPGLEAGVSARQPPGSGFPVTPL